MNIDLRTPAINFDGWQRGKAPATATESPLEPGLKIEFDAGETIDNFRDVPWWRKFEDATLISDAASNIGDPTWLKARFLGHQPSSAA